MPAIGHLASARSKGFDGLLCVNAPNVIVESVKWAEKGKAFVVRLYEAGRTGCAVRVKFNTKVRSVSETNMLEEEPKKLDLRKDAVAFSLRPFEIKTLLCRI